MVIKVELVELRMRESIMIIIKVNTIHLIKIKKIIIKNLMKKVDKIDNTG